MGGGTLGGVPLPDTAEMTPRILALGLYLSVVVCVAGWPE